MGVFEAGVGCVVEGGGGSPGVGQTGQAFDHSHLLYYILFGGSVTGVFDSLEPQNRVLLALSHKKDSKWVVLVEELLELIRLFSILTFS